MELDILAMLKTAIAAGIVLLVGAWALYIWLKRTGQLPVSEVAPRETLRQEIKSLTERVTRLESALERAKPNTTGDATPASQKTEGNN